MSHPTHRDRKQIIEFKHAPAVLDDEEASRIEALLAAGQRQEHDRPTYRESAQPDERGQES